MHNKIPTSEYASEIIERFSGSKLEKVSRFSTGNCHFVYEVVTTNERKYVARIAFPENKTLQEGALFWNRLLKPKGVNLPEIYHFDLEDKFPYLILERLNGVDLWKVYAELSISEKKSLAKETAKLQMIAKTLPEAKTFGYLETYESKSGSKSWLDLSLKMTDRSRKRIKDIGVFDTKIVDDFDKKIFKYENYFLEVEPKAYFNDITTKNVLIDDGRFSGIVDVDSMCFGDCVQTIGLTKMALLQDNQSLDYIDFWADEMNLNSVQRKMINLYATAACVDFISEIGQQFNNSEKVEIDYERAEKLHDILSDLMKKI